MIKIVIMFKGINATAAKEVKRYDYNDANVKRARNMVDRLDNKYGSYAHQIKYLNTLTNELTGIPPQI